MMKFLLKQVIFFVIFFVAFAVQLFAQCEEISSNYPSYFLKRSFALDSIEGKWYVNRTVRILKNNRPIKIVKEKNNQTWFVLRQDGNFVVCNEKISIQNVVIYFTKSTINSAKYIFNMSYLEDSQKVNAYISFSNKKIFFTCSETVKRVKQLFKDNFSDEFSIEYDYEMEKDNHYSAAIVESVPKVKNVIIKGIKSYFNL